jgi:multisubunit Na+/H+ antiporter MnhB subunit
VMAFFIARWSRGLLPLAASLGVLLLALAAIAGLGLTGTSWYDRTHSSYAGAHALGGGSGLSAGTLGAFVLLLVPVELVLVVVAIVGFTQGWNVEQEVPRDLV